MKKITIKEMQDQFKKEYSHLFERNETELSLSWRRSDEIGDEIKATLPDFTTEDTEIDPLRYKLSLRVPLIFDHRMIPDKYNGYQVEVWIKDSYSYPEWDYGNIACDTYAEHMDPQRYENFVKRCANEIREKLKSPTMTFEEMLDAICYGDFKKYKADYEKVLNEKEDRLITARKFISAFKSFLASGSEKQGESVSDNLRLNFSGNNRSKIILGNQKYGKVSPLGNYLEKSFNNQIECRTEYDKLDLILATPANYEFKNWDESHQKESYGFYPKVFDIIIEHENDFKRCWQEMIRLTHLKARLKVLITYNNPAEKNQKHVEITDLLKTNFGKIIEQTNQVYPEYHETEYLLIVGQKVYTEPENYLSWTCYAYDYEGNYILIE